MADELKDSGTVTALAVVGFVFGLIGMLGSFIPCIGSLAFYISIPSSILSGIALMIANSQKAKKTFAVVALTIGLIGTVVSGYQYFSIISAGESARRNLARMSDQFTRAETYRKSNSTNKEIAEPIQIVWYDSIWVDKNVETDGVTIVPAISFKIKNTSGRPLQNIKFYCIFVFEESGKNLTDGDVIAIKNPLPPGQISEEIFVKGYFGFRASSKQAFIKNKANWKSVKVKIYMAKYHEGILDMDGKSPLGTFPINKKIEGLSE
ncbi:MAG: hypothetical protein JW786_11890 [Desulfobacterales bacterium]|nr:hypothetical protein [Desulfobacterales bacterium]